MSDRGWVGLPVMEIDGKAWPLDFAARYLEMPEEDLRGIVKAVRLQPVGTVRMSEFSRSGRQPRAYEARKLIIIAEAIRNLTEELGLQAPSA